MNDVFDRPLDFAQYCSDLFNGESNQKGVLRKLVSTISQWFGLERVNYVSMSTRRHDGEGNQNIVTFHEHEGFSQETLLSLRLSLQTMLVGEDEVQTGASLLQVSDGEYLCVQFDESNASRGVLIWKGNTENLSKNFPRCEWLSKQTSWDILEYVVRAAQLASRWFNRLDSAQSLLYLDEVTGLYNYRFLDISIEGELRRFQRFQVPFSLLFIDLDNFKQVNDRHGHLTGSSVLRQVGAEIKAAVRDIDSVIRYGGDEFVVVLIGANSRQACAAAERIRARVDSAPLKGEGSHHTIHITTSIGVACCPDHGRDRVSIIKIADESMYRAKNGGKNKVIIYPKNESTDSHVDFSSRREHP